MPLVRQIRSNWDQRLDPNLHQIAFFRTLIRTGAVRNPATCGTNQGGLKRRSDPTLEDRVPFVRQIRSNWDQRLDPNLHQIVFFRTLIRTGAVRNPAACGTNQGDLKRQFDPRLRAVRPLFAKSVANGISGSTSTCIKSPFFKSLVRTGRSPESGGLWYKSRWSEKTS